MSSKTRYRHLAVLAFGALAALVITFAAQATGSPTLANAPVLQAGVQAFGNTGCCADGGDPRNLDGQDLSHREFWKIRLTAGDRVTLNWTSATDEVRLGAFAPSTNDFNFNDRDAAPAAYRGDLERKGEMRFTAGGSGLWSLRFGTHWQAKPSAYDFSYTVKHVVRLALKPVAAVRRTGRVSLSVRTPDSSPITAAGLKLRLEGFWANRWHLLATGRPKAGVAHFTLRLPRTLQGETIKLRARASGASYLPARSLARSVRVR